MKQLACCLALASLFVACKKDDIIPPVNYPVTMIATSIKIKNKARLITKNGEIKDATTISNFNKWAENYFIPDSVMKLAASFVFLSKDSASASDGDGRIGVKINGPTILLQYALPFYIVNPDGTKPIFEETDEALHKYPFIFPTPTTCVKVIDTYGDMHDLMMPFYIYHRRIVNNATQTDYVASSPGSCNAITKVKLGDKDTLSLQTYEIYYKGQ
ncbi:hypothetical protein DCC81_15715 [Chitinophaga parva]|uniref:Uncharacterized protein n=1 Tax=Chitinophaga parva TaxID=2169414 RepID=A0A2T7BHJ2_9BACT|nr:hypothetical protein [Chitinophaga parva]PUZ25713.1 hypothetical protein DCC81_15715 [Chitinophaga parva]